MCFRFQEFWYKMEKYSSVNLLTVLSLTVQEVNLYDFNCWIYLDMGNYYCVIVNTYYWKSNGSLRRSTLFIHKCLMPISTYSSFSSNSYLHTIHMSLWNFLQYLKFINYFCLTDLKSSRSSLCISLAHIGFFALILWCLILLMRILFLDILHFHHLLLDNILSGWFIEWVSLFRQYNERSKLFNFNVSMQHFIPKYITKLKLNLLINKNREVWW